MHELRKDYLFDEYVIIANERSKRPNEFTKIRKTKVKIPKFDKNCNFCPGNEKSTPKEILQLRGKKNDWKMRVFPNKYPAVVKYSEFKIKKKNQYYYYGNAHGYAEIIVETERHDYDLADLKQEELFDLFLIYKDRIHTLSKRKGIKYVSIYKNQGEKAGASLNHSHSQVLAYNIVPSVIRRKEQKSIHECPYCNIIQNEKTGNRICYENTSFFAFCPFASKFSYELLVLPKKHLIDTDELNDSNIKDLSEIFYKVMKKLKRLNCDYNFYIQYGVKNLHLQLLIIPRFSNWAGFEYLTGTVINSISPEKAAEFYRSNN